MTSHLRYLVPLLVATAIVPMGTPAYGQSSLDDVASVTTSVDLVLDWLNVTAPVVDGPSAAHVTATVWNSDTIEVRAVVRYGWNSMSTPLDGNLAQSDVLTIPPRASRGFHFNWTPEPDQAGNGTVYAEVSPVDFVESRPADNRRSTPVFVRTYGFSARFAELEQPPTVSQRIIEAGTVPRYEAVPVRFMVKNVGNEDDVANVSAVAPVGWWTHVPQPIVALHADEEVETYVLVRPPQDANRSTVARAASITVTSNGFRLLLPEESQGDPAVQRSTALDTPTISISESHEANFSLEARLPQGTLHMTNATTREMRVTLTNRGYVWDAFNVTWNSTDSAAPKFAVRGADRDVNPFAVQVALPPNATRELRLLVSSDKSLHVTDRVSLVVEARSVNWEQASLTANVTLRSSGADLRVISIGAPAPTYRDVGGVLSVVGDNLGDTAVSGVPLALRYLRQGIWTNVSNERLAISAPGLGSWAISVPLNTSGLTGAYQVEATVDPESTLAEYDETNNQATGEFFARTARLELAPPPARTVLPGQRVAYGEQGPGFYVKNTGNHDETVELHVTSERGLFNARATQVIPKGHTVGIPISFDLPLRPGSTRDNLLASVVIPAEGRLRLNSVTPLIFEDRSPPVITVRVPPSATLGERVPITATILDETMVTGVLATVNHSDGTSEIVALTLSEPDSYHGTFVAVSVGPTAVQVKARDSAAVPLTTTTDRVIVDVRAPLAKPVIGLSAPSPRSAIGPGAEVRWTVTSPSPLRGVTYSVAGGPWTPISPPYSIPTDAWFEGKTQLKVQAEDVYSNRAEAVFVIDKDLTPPVITEVQVQPRGDGVYEVRVRSNGDAVRGLLTIEGGEQYRLTGSEPFTALVAARPGAQLRVALEDAVGNVIAEDRVIDPDRATPLPPWLAVMAGIVVAALRGPRGRDVTPRTAEATGNRPRGR